MPLPPLSRSQLLNASTTYPWTKDLRHLAHIPRFWLRRKVAREPYIKSVATRDRIKWWNIVPGDQIRLLGDKSNTMYDVYGINRISNRVFVRGGVNVRSFILLGCRGRLNDATV